jgi:mono/diheme cytochrome c family protein
MSAVQSMRAGIGIVVLASTLVVAVVAGAARGLETPEQTVGTSQLDQILLGRRIVVSHGCGDCHGGGPDPSAEGWLAGGDPLPVSGMELHPPNLTPDDETGIGRYTDRQLFNALRFGLRPSTTPDIEMTSARPGVGNHPGQPDYLAPAMPWTSWRHMSDAELRAVIAYLRHAVRPVRNAVTPNEKPPHGWTEHFAESNIGPYPLVAFPTANEELRREDRRENVLRGRRLVASLGCSDCHGGVGNPAASGWMVGSRSETNTGNGRPVGPFEEVIDMGQFKVAARNLTPDNVTGIGRFSERQIFNALRYGLRPGETEDVEITSTVPGQGNHPQHPKYLAPAMPWLAWRHLTDQELHDIASYLLYGLKPVRNRLPDSEGPPDFWASAYSQVSPYPAAPFPTQRERAPSELPPELHRE